MSTLNAAGVIAARDALGLRTAVIGVVSGVIMLGEVLTWLMVAVVLVVYCLYDLLATPREPAEPSQIDPLWYLRVASLGPIAAREQVPPRARIRNREVTSEEIAP